MHPKLKLQLVSASWIHSNFFRNFKPSEDATFKPFQTSLYHGFYRYLTTLPLITLIIPISPSPPAEVTNIVVTSEVATQVIFGCPSICMNLMGTSQVFFFRKTIHKKLGDNTK